jgi:hypothetical protein
MEETKKKKSIKEQEDEIRALLQKHVHREIKEDHESFCEFLGIMMMQPQWLEKLEKIYAFRVTRGRTKNKPLLLQIKLFNRNHWYTVSWRKSVSKPRKEPDPSHKTAPGRPFWD